MGDWYNTDRFAVLNASPWLVEIFDCGHGHKSMHEHEVCQVCGKGKPVERWRYDSSTGKYDVYWRKEEEERREEPESGWAGLVGGVCGRGLKGEAGFREH